MLAEAYNGVSTQCAASVALQHADAKTTALMQLADLLDEGLGREHLLWCRIPPRRSAKPTAEEPSPSPTWIKK